LIGKVASSLYSKWALANSNLGTNSTNNTAVDAKNYTVDGLALVLETDAPQIEKIIIDKANGTYYTGEEIFFHVYFSREVAVEGDAKLLLNSGGVAQLVRNGGNLQTFDIGVDATAALEHYCCGKFQLGLGDDKGGCMQWDNNVAVMRGVHILPELANSGVLDPWPNPFEATEKALHGGYRWTLKFPNGGVSDIQYPRALKPLNGDECTEFSPPGDGSAIVRVANSKVLAFRYVVGKGEVSGSLGPRNSNALKLIATKRNELDFLRSKWDLLVTEGKDTCLSAPDANYTDWYQPSYIRRSSFRPLQDANLTIPTAAVNDTSLSGVVVNATPAVILSVKSVLGERSFTQGEVIQLVVKFDRAVWLVDTYSGVDVESGEVVMEGTGQTRPIKSRALISVDSCEGSSDGNDALTLALDTVRVDSLEDNTVSINGSSVNVTLNEEDNWSDQVARAKYVNGSGTRELYFSYTVRPYEATNGLLEYSNFSALELREGFDVIVRSTFSSHSADVHLPRRGYPGSLSYDQNVTIYASAREVTSIVKVTADVPEGCYDPGKLIHIHVIFSRCVRTPNSLPEGVSLKLQLTTGTLTELTAADDNKGRDFASMLIFPWVVGHSEHTTRTTVKRDALFLSKNDTRCEYYYYYYLPFLLLSFVYSLSHS
jgi:hypothetical protein